MRQCKIRPTNYYKLAIIDQSSSENPTGFLDQLKEAVTKYTNVDPDSPEGELMLKDRFITQSATDIRRKLQKLALGPSTHLGELLKMTDLFFHS